MARYVYGIHPLEALLKAEAAPEEVLVKAGEQGPAIRRIVQGARDLGIKLRFVSAEELARLCQGGNHQGVVAKVGDFKYADFDLWAREAPALPHKPDLLVLDGVQDPHNLGAILRTADAFAIGAVIIPKDNSCEVSEAASRVAAGAAEKVPVMRVTNLVRCLEQLKELGYWAYGTAGESTTSLYDAKLDGPLAFVFGGEGAGLRRLVREHCDLLLALPCLGTVSSLNVSVSVGMVLGENYRQKRR